MRRSEKKSYSQKIDNLYGPLSFAWMIKILREEAKMSRKEMAEKLGMSVKALEDLETGAHIPSPQFVILMQKKLSSMKIPAMGLIQLAVRDARYKRAGVMRL